MLHRTGRREASIALILNLNLLLMRAKEVSEKLQVMQEWKGSTRCGFGLIEGVEVLMPVPLNWGQSCRYFGDNSLLAGCAGSKKCMESLQGWHMC